MTFDSHDTISRVEVERAFDRVEARIGNKQDDIMKAVADLKLAMNGQFAAQGALLNKHDGDIRVLYDRAGRDNGARLTAAAGVALAAIASYFGFKP